MPLGKPSAVALTSACLLLATLAVGRASHAADPQAVTAPALTGSIRSIEGRTETTSGILEDFNRTKRVRWEPGPSYAGIAVDQVEATFLVNGSPAARMASIAVFEKLATPDPALQRPPTVVLTVQGAEYRGVLEALSYKCAVQRCTVNVTVLGGTPTAKPADDTWQWGSRP